MHNEWELTGIKTNSAQRIRTEKDSLGNAILQQKCLSADSMQLVPNLPRENTQNTRATAFSERVSTSAKVAGIN